MEREKVVGGVREKKQMTGGKLKSQKVVRQIKTEKKKSKWLGGKKENIPRLIKGYIRREHPKKQGLGATLLRFDQRSRI